LLAFFKRLGVKFLISTVSIKDLSFPLEEIRILLLIRFSFFNPFNLFLIMDCLLSIARFDNERFSRLASLENQILIKEGNLNTPVEGTRSPFKGG